MSNASTMESRQRAAQWHARDAAHVLAELETDARRGLDASVAAARLEEYGPNSLPEEERESALLRFLKQFHNVLIYILIVAAAFTAFLGEWIDTGVIVAVIIVNAVIGFVQEGRAERALDEIRRMLSTQAAVLRDGKRTTLSAEELVPGDIVLLESGDRVPADLRIIAAREARAEEAALTGESQPVEKTVESVAEDALTGDRTSLAFSGTLLTSGRLRGVVVATGERTEIGRIGRMVSGVEKLTTPLLAKLDRFGRVLSAAIVLLGAALFLFGMLLRGYSAADMFLIVVSFAVAAIPEGLPAILTVTLALGVQRMSRRNAIVRRLPAVETLGSVTTICSDKTGTLTRNEMTAGRIVLHDAVVTVTGAGYSAEGELLIADEPAAQHPVLQELAAVAVLCNDANVTQTRDDDGEPRTAIHGDPTDAALVVLGEKAGFGAEQLRAEHEHIDTIPFESANRFMATLTTFGSERRILLKGAPERVLEMCDRTRTANADDPLDVEEWRTRIDDVAGEGYRMIALAVRAADSAQERLTLADVGAGFTLLGAVGLMDPPRAEAMTAVEECRNAGIRVVMITGDHALTARSIADQLGIGNGAEPVTGHDIERADDAALERLAAERDVVARASPEHKLRLVRALQARGHVIAMTGDGVNDAPALKQADIGVAMGIKGTEAARSAAEMVLADDNFASIERAVEEGRTVYDNLRKTILFILPTNGAEALMVMAAVAFAMAEMPITPVQILWVNMVTAVTLALALAFEGPEPDIMQRPPRPRDEPILSRYLLFRIGYVAVIVAAACIVLFLVELREGVVPDRARTVAVNALVTAEAFYLLNCRFLRAPAYHGARLLQNRSVIGAIGTLAALQLAFTYLPLAHTLFGTAPIRPLDWAWCLLLGASVFVLVEVEKGFVRRRRARDSA